MSVVARTRRRQWTAVLVGILALSWAPVALAVQPVDAADVDVETLRDHVLAASNVPYEGFVQTQGNAGIPELPALSGVADLFDGTSRLRAWFAAPDRWRVDQLSATGEIGFYRTALGTEVWDFESNQLTRVIGDLPVRLPWAADLTPPALTQRMLAFMTPRDRLQSLPDSRIAGVAAAGFRIVPDDPGSTVGHLDIWADPDSGLPLRAELVARGDTTPVLVTRFLEVRQREPDDDVLRPPSGGGITIDATSQPDVISWINAQVTSPLPPQLAGTPRRQSAAGLSGVGTYGTGWSSFVVFGVPGRLGERLSTAIGDGGGQPADVTGGRAIELTRSLLTILVVRADSDRREATYVLAGTVTGDVLRRVAADLLATDGDR